MAIDYFYDGQLNRYRLQFGRIFSTIQAYSGIDKNGNAVQSVIPAIPASTDLQVMNILANNSENVISTLPMFAYYITEFHPSPERRQNPHYVRDINVTYREYDKLTGEYKSTVGNQYHVQNYMPVPYDVTFRLDLWYSNDQTRDEVVEQICTLFNPMIDIQTNRNLLDWSSLSVVILKDVDWNPVTYGSTMDMTKKIITFWFTVPIWLNPPSKVKKSNIIQEIITNVNAGTSQSINDGDISGTSLTTSVVTPGNFSIKISRDYSKILSYQIELLVDPNNKQDELGVDWSWKVLTQRYGTITEGSSKILLLTNLDDLSHDIDYNLSADDNNSKEKIIAGTISYDDTSPLILNYDVDTSTIPQYYNDTFYIDGFIDPTKELPFENIGGITSSCNRSGFTYLILNTIPQGSKIWGDVYENGVKIGNIDAAVQNDILEYDGTRWNKIFNSITNKDGTFYGQNSCNGDPLTFSDGSWRLTIDGVYNPGYWRINL